MDLGLQLTGAEKAEQLVGVELKLLTGLDVAEKSGTRDLHTLGREFPASTVSPTIGKYFQGMRDTYGRGIGGTGPLALPNQTIVPLRLTASKLPSQVSFPTES